MCFKLVRLVMRRVGGSLSFVMLMSYLFMIRWVSLLSFFFLEWVMLYVSLWWLMKFVDGFRLYWVSVVKSIVCVCLFVWFVLLDGNFFVDVLVYNFLLFDEFCYFYRCKGVVVLLFLGFLVYFFSYLVKLVGFFFVCCYEIKMFIEINI